MFNGYQDTKQTEQARRMHLYAKRTSELESQRAVSSKQMILKHRKRVFDFVS